MGSFILLFGIENFTKLASEKIFAESTRENKI